MTIRFDLFDRERKFDRTDMVFSKTCKCSLSRKYSRKVDASAKEQSNAYLPYLIDRSTDITYNFKIDSRLFVDFASTPKQTKSR